jgi:glutathione S-transferase
MAFAVAAAQLVLPDGYGGPLPAFDEMPAAIRSAVVETRARPAGRFVQRIYRDHRAEGDPRAMSVLGTVASKGEDHEHPGPA